MRTPFSSALVLGLLCVNAADGGEFRHPSGLIFRYPDDWYPVSKETLNEARPLMPEGVRNWMDQNKIDFERTAAVVIHGEADDFVENVNVVIENQQIQINQKSVATLLDMMPRLFQQIGMKVEKVEAKIANVGDDAAIVAEYEFQVLGSPLKMRQRQVHFPGDGKSFIVTCTAAAESFEQEAAAFDAILTSMQIPAPKKIGFDWTRIALSAVIGAALAVAVGLVSRLFIRRPNQPAGDEHPSDVPA